MNYFLHILIMIGIYIILALSLNFLTGYGGLLSLAHAAFYGIGAYTYTLLIMKLAIAWPVSILLAVLFTSFVSFLAAYPFLRLKGDYFILGTIGFQMIVFDILYNWIPLTRGPYGIPGIYRFSILGHTLNSIPENFFLVAFITGIVVLIFYVLYRSPFARILKTLREDEVASVSLGKHTTKVKIWTFVVSGGIAAIAGALYASYITYIDPTSFTLDESIFILTIVLVGGAGNLKGPLLGACILVILPELLRFIGLPSTIAPNVRQIIYALLLIIIMLKRPKGIAGEYGFE